MRTRNAACSPAARLVRDPRPQSRLPAPPGCGLPERFGRLANMRLATMRTTRMAKALQQSLIASKENTIQNTRQLMPDALPLGEDGDSTQARSSRWPLVLTARASDRNAACGRDGRKKYWCPRCKSRRSRAQLPARFTKGWIGERSAEMAQERPMRTRNHKTVTPSTAEQKTHEPTSKNATKRHFPRSRSTTAHIPT